MSATRTRAIGQAVFLAKLWLCVWVLVLGLRTLLEMMNLGLPTVVSTGLMTAVMTPTIFYGVVPRLSRKP